MSLSAYGVPGTLDTDHWSELMDDVAPPRVVTGLTVSAPTGTRLVSVAAGRSVQAGSLVISTAAVEKTLDANSSGQPRIDVICLQVDFSGTTSTAATIEVVKGTPAATPVPPTVVSDPGGLVKVPLGQVPVPNAAGQLVSADIVDVRPGILVSNKLSLPGAWSVPTSSPLSVERGASDMVTMSGRFTRTTAHITAGTIAEFSGAAVIPPGFRPSRTAGVFYASDLGDASPVYGKLLVLTDGTMTLYHHTGTIEIGQTVRVLNANWIGA